MTDLRLTLASTDRVLVDAIQVIQIYAEDGSGKFSLARGHADFFALLEPSVLSWREINGRQCFAAVNDAILYLESGHVQVLAREIVLGDHPHDLLGGVISARLRNQAEAEKAARATLAMEDAVRRRMHTLARHS